MTPPPCPLPGTRQRIADWITLRTQFPGITAADAARRMGITKETLHRHITTARREGWLDFTDSLDRLEFEIIPKTLDNLNHLLDKGDAKATIETAKGTVFKEYQAAKGVSDTIQTVLALTIEPAEGSGVKVVTGTIVGKPREIAE